MPCSSSSAQQLGSAQVQRYRPAQGAGCRASGHRAQSSDMWIGGSVDRWVGDWELRSRSGRRALSGSSSRKYRGESATAATPGPFG
jgi:hypothetical protein